ncbi:MAG: PadR family transcriptional regulator [Candidatus Saccharibacteria bacterium]
MELQAYIDNTAAQMRKGILEFCVLLAISASGEAYASDILNRLKEFNLIILEGTLYPILSRLKEAELVSYSWAESNEGPPRKYYRLTEKGQQAAERMKENFRTLNDSINELINSHE